MVFNAALIRRRIRSPRLCVEHLEVGETSRTDVAVCYFEGRADPELVNTVRERIAQARVDALTMNQESLAELLVRKRWYNPFPKFKFTERPDAAAAQILEGDVVVLVDNSPAAIILPTTLFDVMEEANDYYFPPITGSYLRLVRFFTTFLTTFLTPVWLLLIQEPERVPGWLEFILMEEPAQVPPLLQLLILELAIDGLKLAALNTPNILTTSFSMIGAIILGDFAVQSGWFSAEVMLYMAVVAIANYNQPNLELGYALKFMRLILLVATGLSGPVGLCGRCGVAVFGLVSNRTISGAVLPLSSGPLQRRGIEEKAAADRERPSRKKGRLTAGRSRMPPCWKRKRDRSGPCVTGARPVLLFGWERAWLGSGHQQVEGAAVCDALVQGGAQGEHGGGGDAELVDADGQEGGQQIRVGPQLPADPRSRCPPRGRRRRPFSEPGALRGGEDRKTCPGRCVVGHRPACTGSGRWCRWRRSPPAGPAQAP